MEPNSNFNQSNIIDKATNVILNDSLIKKNLYNYTWIGGSSTKVYPITLWVERGEIVIQLNSKKNKFNKCIERIIKNSNGLIVYGSFNKNDGSCPATLSFYTNYSFIGNSLSK